MGNEKKDERTLKMAEQYYEDVRQRNMAKRGVPPEMQVKLQADVMRRLEILKGDMNYPEFAEKCGIGPGAMYNYMHGVRFPGVAVLKMIADRCNVSLDWLTGCEEEKEETAE